MDPLAHTLVGASLAQTRLRDWTPLAAPALILGANAPDIDAVTMLMGQDLALGFRRGLTHGVLAMVVLPVALAVLLAVIGGRRGARPRLRSLVAVCAIAVWTHPLLDWLNNYGIRLLMPFDGRWFYGDSLFIVDPWLWLVGAAPLVLAGARTRVSVAAWALLGLLTSALVLRAPIVPPAARAVWCVGVAAIVIARSFGAWPAHRAKLATGALTLIAVYAAAMRAGSMVAAEEVREWLAARGVVALDVMASPVPADPLERRIVAADGARYHLLDLRFGREPRILTRAPALDVGATGPIVDAARAAPQVHGLVTWMRFPSYRVESRGSGYRVFILDARSAGRGPAPFGQTFVDLDANLDVVSPDGR